MYSEGATEFADHVDDVLFVVQLEPHVELEYVSGAIEGLSGLRRTELAADPALWPRHLDPGDVDVVARALAVPVGQPVEFTVDWRRQDGSMVRLQNRGRKVRREDGSVALFGVARAATDQLLPQPRVDITDNERKFRLAMQSSPIGLTFVDLARNFTEVNPAFCEMVGRDEEWLLSHGVPDVLDLGEGDEDLKLKYALLTDQASSESQDVKIIRPDGSPVWLQQIISILRDEYGEPLCFVSQYVDLTAKHREDEQVRFLATHDALTRLLNRTEMIERTDQMLSHPRRRQSDIALLFLDLDRFKEVNDRYGHLIGDQVMVEVAERISGAIRMDDLFARVGGDELVVVLTNLHEGKDALVVANKIHQALASPISTEVDDIYVSVSIGLTVATATDSTRAMMKRADAALYQAKRDGRSRTVESSPQVDLRQETRIELN